MGNDKQPTTVADALRWTVKTAAEQPGQFPEAPAGWLLQAQQAVSSGDDVAIRAAAETILKAHSQYGADFDTRAWLYELRNAFYTTNLYAA